MLKEAAWDEAVEFLRKRERRKRSPGSQGHGRPIYGMPGATAPERRVIS